MSDLLLYSIPVGAILALAAIPRGLASGKRAREWYAFMHRAPADVRPGPGHFEVETIGSEATNLGHSLEGKTTSATPTLASEPVILKMVGGPRIRLTPGAKLVIRGLPGASRRTVDTTTTAVGISNKITFEVPPGTRFWTCFVLGSGASGEAPGGAAYRDDVILETSPIGEYFVTTEMPRAPTPLRAAILYAIGFALVGTFFGVFITDCSHSGCRGGRHAVPPEAILDALGIGLLLAIVGAHMGVGSLLPAQATKMTKQPDGRYVMR